MNPLVVLFACLAAASASYVAQPHNHPAIVLDAHARPLDTAEVIHARAIHYQAKALEHTPLLHSGIVPAVVASPLVSTYANPLLGYAAGGHGYGYGLGGHGYGYGLGGHYLKKRSIGAYGLSAPIIARSGDAAITHQYRHDVISSPAVVSHAIAAPVISHHAIAAPVLAHHAIPAAVSHQSRVDVHSSPAIVAHSVVAAPAYGHSLIGAHSGYGHGLLGAHSGYAHSLLGAHSGYGHFLKKRSLGAYALSAPILAHSPAVSHQSRVDVISSPAYVSHSAPLIHAAPITAYAAPAVSHQSRVDVISSPAYGSHYGHSGLLASPLSHHGLYSHAGLW